MPEACTQPPLAEALHTLQVVLIQDLEPDPDDGRMRVRKGVAAERRVSIEDSEMRHGRKSSAKRFDGYKRHISRDLDEQTILAAEVTPGNRYDPTQLAPLLASAEAQGRELEARHIDRAYLDEQVVPRVDGQGQTS